VAPEKHLLSRGFLFQESKKNDEHRGLSIRHHFLSPKPPYPKSESISLRLTINDDGFAIYFLSQVPTWDFLGLITRDSSPPRKNTAGIVTEGGKIFCKYNNEIIEMLGEQNEYYSLKSSASTPF